MTGLVCIYAVVVICFAMHKTVLPGPTCIMIVVHYISM